MLHNKIICCRFDMNKILKQSKMNYQLRLYVSENAYELISCHSLHGQANRALILEAMDAPPLSGEVYIVEREFSN